MPVELEWESGAQPANGGDPQPSPQRFNRWWRIVFVVVFLIAGIAIAIILRLAEIERWQLRTLQDAFNAELAALRIGDLDAFLALQHQGDEIWVNQQVAYFHEVQASPHLNLIGEIIDSEISENGDLGIIHFREVEDGIPYERLWFYWSFEEAGWRHLPQNTGLWGEAATIASNFVEIRHASRDALLAEALAQTLPGWMELGCQVLSCTQQPGMLVEIIADPNLTLSWHPINPWHMRIPSPLLSRMRSDQPFSPRLQQSLAELVSTQLFLTSPMATIESSSMDDRYFRQALYSWLVTRFLGIKEISPLLDSVIERYGVHPIASAVNDFGGLKLLPALRKATQSSLAELALLDWRDYLEWKIRQYEPEFVGKIATLQVTEEKGKIRIHAWLQPPESDSSAAEFQFEIIGDDWHMISDGP